MIEEDYSFLCPYCGTSLTARLDASGGKHQKFIQDCEVCCRPIQIEAHFKGEEIVHFSADAEP